MATVPHTALYPTGTDSSRLRVVQWGPLTTTNRDGEWVMLPSLPDKTVHVYGTFGAAATLTLEGSNEPGTPANQVPVNDTRGESNALIFLTAGGNDIKQMLENPPKVRPNLTGGDETTALTVLIVCKG